MKVADYLIEYLVAKGVTDLFGIPGDVILDFLYAAEKNSHITAHLNYHEQCSIFAACGYAQTESKIGVAYCTRGPGFTNMITGIAEAFCESIPIMIITAHSNNTTHHEMRVEFDQELNPIPLISNITKYATRIEDIADVYNEIEYAYQQATTGRKGPVLLDFSSVIWEKELPFFKEKSLTYSLSSGTEFSDLIAYMHNELKLAKRPVLLIGDGIRQSGTTKELVTFATSLSIPVLSSRASQDIMSTSPLYFGYIGSHATRYSNFILSKADLLISLGNRMSFPIHSQSFSSATANKKIIRIDIDTTEFLREIPNTKNFNADLKPLLSKLITAEFSCNTHNEWLKTCNLLANRLWYHDLNEPIKQISSLLKKVSPDTTIVSDVGNNEFWLSRAYAYSKVSQRILYSKSFGTLGCSLGKTIGAYYYTRKPVICFTGDQGFQFNTQELQFIAKEQLPVMIFLLNNQSSGMIRSREYRRYGDFYVHTTTTSGYSCPDFSLLAKAYKINYQKWEKNNDFVLPHSSLLPCLIELVVDEEIGLEPNLPTGNACHNLSPELPIELFIELDNL